MSPSESVESYIVRIYRRPATPNAPLTGVVEDPVRATLRAFHSSTELAAILGRAGDSLSHPRAGRRRRSKQ